MSRKLVAALIAALSFAAFVAASPAETPTAAPPAAEMTAAQPAAQAAPSCRVTPWRKYRRAVRRTWRYSHRNGDFRAAPKPGRRAQRRLGRLRHVCSPPERRQAKMLRHVRERRAAWRWHRYIDRITPFGAWAVPVAVVRCEGGVGGWGVKNHEGSGAAGPYQLLGHGAPMPASTPAARARHHEIAASLYRASGLGPWAASRHCWS